MQKTVNTLPPRAIVAAKDKVCQGCGARGAGNHRDLRCPYLREEARRATHR